MVSKSNYYAKHPYVNQAGIKWKEFILNWRGLTRGDPKIVAIVTTKCEESAEAIVPAYSCARGRAESCSAIVIECDL